MSKLSLIKLLEKNFVKFSNNDNHQYDLSDLTIIIPTYNRPSYLIRQIIYLSNCSANLIITDGSEKKVNQEVIDQLKIFRNFQYIYSSDLSYVDRIKLASEKIQSKYAMCLAEDDFIIFSGLEKAMSNLKNDNSLSACFGQIAALDYDKSKNKSYLIEYGSSLNNYSIRHSNPRERVLFSFNSYRSFSAYAVFKKIHFKEVWSRIDTSFCPELTEYEHAINTLLIGQIKTVDELFWIRSQELESLDSKLDGSRKNTFKKWYNDKFFEKDIQKFKERATNNLVHYLNCSSIEASEFLNEVIECILNKDNHTGLVNKSNFKYFVSLLIYFIKSFSVSANINKKIKNTFFGIKLRSLIKKFGIKRINTNLYKKNVAEIEKIFQITDSFHKEL